jgi:membrane-associated phospholipid phosphatase
MLTTITDLGDSALLLPASLALSLYLWARGSRRPALLFATTVLACIALTALTKIGFRGCGVDAPIFDLRSPSGHAALGTTFYLCGALLLTADATRLVRAMALAAATMLLVLISTSRVLLQAHTPIEVATGLLIGIACVAGFALTSSRLPKVKSGWRLSIAIFVALAVITNGHHLNAEELLGSIAMHIRQATGVCG